MGKRTHTNLVIRGVTYPTSQAAAKALGVNDETIYYHVRNGTLDRCGLRRSHPRPMPVMVGGKEFRTAKAAAAHFGVTVAAIYRAINDGAPERIGKPQPYNGHRSVPFSLGGQTWPSMSQASRDLGFDSNFIGQVVRKGSKRGMAKILQAAMHRHAAAEADAMRKAKLVEIGYAKGAPR